MKRDRNSNARKCEDEIVGRYENSVKAGKLGYFEVDELETIINHYLDDYKTEEAMSAVNFGKKLHPNSTALLTKQARLYFEIGQTGKALSIIDQVQTIDSNDEDALLLKGEIFLRKGLVPDAMAIFREMERNAGEDDSCTFLNIAYVMNDCQRFDDALKLLEKANAIDPNNTDILFEKTYSLEQKEEYDEAIETYNHILDIDPYANEAWFNLGQLFSYKGLYSKAIEAFDYAYTITPTDYQSLFQKANVLFLCEKYQEAAEAYEEYSDLTGETSSTCILIGECLEKMNDVASAEVLYKKAYAMDEKNVDALKGLCICSLDQENPKEALEIANKAIRLAGESSELLIYKAEALVFLEKINEAIICYKRALNLDPQQVDVLIALGNLHVDSGKYEIALHYYQQAKMIQKDADKLPLLLAITFYKLQDYQMCVKHLQESMETNDQTLSLFYDFCPEAIDDIELKKFGI